MSTPLFKVIHTIYIFWDVFDSLITFWYFHLIFGTSALTTLPLPNLSLLDCRSILLMKLLNRPKKFTNRKIALIITSLRRVSLRMICESRTLLYCQSWFLTNATRGGRSRHPAQLTSAALVVFVPRARQLWRLMGCYSGNSLTSTGYCSCNCYTHSIYQGRLPQEIVPHLYSICIALTASLSHPAPLRPSLVRLHSGFPLWLSLLCPMFSWSLGPSWSGPPLSGICKLACVQLHTHDTRGQ